ncbi:YdbH domain-containing protein [Nitrosomonas oligotropha]|uniref:YdbH domain-containing protein n=1 Tax=Nitrosomonas oligotropha TaxID=42354 RepID=UPI00136A09B7|nr:YdbH domain-containing protein [Nitrosomonas oligotropha]MXS82182.1 dienelactone hydrolase [Nitrosomonas oligotropha]
MGKLLKTGLLILISLAVFAGAGLYVFRNPLLETLIGQQLNKQGLPLQSIADLDLSFNTFRLKGLSAGKNKELRLDNMLVTWNVPDLLAGKPISVEVSGLHVAFDLNAAHPLLSSTTPMTAAPEKSISLPWLPNFSLKDSAIHLRSTAGDAAIALSGDIAQNQPDTQTIRLSVIVSGSLAQSKSLLTATLDRKGNIQGKFAISDGVLGLPEASISSFSGEAAFSFAALQLQHIQTEFALSGIKLPGKAIVKPVSDSTDKNPLAPALGDTVIDRITLKGDIRASTQSLTGSLDLEASGGQYAAEPLKVQQFSVSLPIQITSNRDNWQVALRNPGQITVGKIDSGTPVHLLNAFQLSIPQANLELAKSSQGWALAHDIAIAPGNLNVRVDRAESSAIEAQIHPGKITLAGKLSTGTDYQGRFTISDAGFTLPQSDLQMKDFSATVHLNDAEIGTAADFAIARLQHLASEPLFAALSITGSVRNEAAAGEPVVYGLNIAGGVPELRYLKISGRHAPASGDGMLQAEIIPIRFSPEGLQPGVLSPALAQLEDVSGHLGANVQFKWSKEGMKNSQAAFELRNLSFARENTKLSDLNINLNLVDLLSPRTPPHQTITIQRIDAGVPLENLLVSYHIEGTSPPRIAIEQAQFSVLEGTIAVVPTVIDPAAARSDTLIRISNIDLETLFNVIKVDGLTGSGHLDGQIPLTLAENQVTITNGHLAAQAPGILRFKSEKASKMMASAGKEMNLLLQAAQDFHYTELSLDLDKSVTHDLVAKLSLLGNNPKVKDGQAFRLNIKLETDIDKILQTINQGYNLSHEILRGSLRFH